MEIDAALLYSKLKTFFGYDAFKSKFRDFSHLFDEICSSSTFRRRSELGGVLQMLKQNRAALFDGNFDAAANEILNSLRDLARLRSSLRMSGFSLTIEERARLRAELAKKIDALARSTASEILRMLKFTDGCRRIPPLYGPMALFIWIR